MKGWTCYLAAGLLIGLQPPAAAQAFEPDDQVVSNVLVNLIDPEFDLAGHRMAWQDTSGNLWIGDIDPDTGDLLPDTGMTTLVDTDLVPLGVTLNGPEWVYGNDGEAIIAYTKLVGATPTLAVARQDAAGAWQTEVLAQGDDRIRPLGTPSSNTGPARIAYLLEPPGQDRLIGWREIDDETTELTIDDPSSQGQRWVESDPMFITTIIIDDVRQVVLVDAETAEIEQLTFDAEPKFLPYMWYAPEFGELIFMTMIDRDLLGIYRKIDDVWTPVYTMTLPSVKPFFHSPEPFVVNGKSYILTVAAEEIGGVGPFPFQPIGPTEIWIAGIDANAPFFRRVDSPVGDKHRLDPEIFNTSGGPVVYYTQRVDQTGGFVLRRAATGLNPEYGYDSGEYGGAWAVMHRDNKNCACTPFLVGDQYTEAYQSTLASTQVVRSTMGPEGNLYFPYFDPASGTNQKAFAAFDSTTGNVQFELAEKTTSENVTAVNATIDADGNLYIPANDFIAKFDTAGERLWATPIRGLSRSAQFTPDGKLILFTWRGWVYTIDPADGAVLAEQNLTPLRSYPDTPSCLAAGDKSDCSFINAPAIDPSTGVIYNTAITRAGSSVLHAYQYDAVTHEVSHLWNRRAPRLTGVASSPVLSGDYTRLYVHDGDTSIRAYDAASGAELWSFDVGFSAGAPPVVTDNGYIMPGGTISDSPAYNYVGILQDDGTSAQWAFQTLTHRPAAAAAAGADDRFVLATRNAGTGTLGLMVVSPVDGVVSVSSWGAGPVPATLKSVTLREDGWAFVTTWGSTAFKAFQPVP